jgi:hypothetical protein
VGARSRRLSRRPAQREPKRKFTIVCEGADTEPSYFGLLKAHFRDALIEIEAIGPAGDPLGVAMEARRRRKASPRHDSFEQADEYWAVFDRDNFNRFDDAVTFCERHSVGCARSNPCFEIWLLHHLTNFDRPCNSQEAKTHWHQQRSIGALDRDLIDQIEQAEERAERQLQVRQYENAPFGCPSTTVHQLTMRIREAASKSKS